MGDVPEIRDGDIPLHQFRKYFLRGQLFRGNGIEAPVKMQFALAAQSAK